MGLTSGVWHLVWYSFQQHQFEDQRGMPMSHTPILNMVKQDGRTLKLVLLACTGMVVAACAPKPVETPAPAPAPVAVVAPPKPVFTATPGLTFKDRLKKSIGLLANGEEGQARAELEACLQENPSSDTAKILIEQIDRDPRDMLGYQSFAYTLKSGETLSVIADRYLGDRYKFWVLAKYNNIANPAGVSVGQQILIPGAPRVIAGKSGPSRTDDDEINDRVEKEKKKSAVAKPVPTTTPTPAPPVAAPAPVAVAANPENAKVYRKQGLEQLQRGNVDMAIAALNRALTYAKGTNLYALISSDLQRAQKIKSNMKK